MSFPKVNQQFLLFASVAVILATVAVVMNKTTPSSRLEVGEQQLANYPLSRQILYEFRAQNMTPRSTKMAEVRAYVSAGHEATQITTKISQADNQSLLADEAGNELILVKFKEMSAGESTKIHVVVNMAYRDKPKTVAEPTLDMYLQDEPFIEVDSEKIKSVVEKIKVDSASDAVTNILSWIKENADVKNKQTDTENIEPRSLPEEYGAIDVLENRHVPQSGRVYLFIALCRAAGIPARGVVGALTDSSIKDERVTLVVLPEYYDEGSWNVVDIMNYKKIDSVSNYIALRTIEEMKYPAGSKIESYLFETVAVNIVPGSLKLRVINAGS